MAQNAEQRKKTIGGTLVALGLILLSKLKWVIGILKLTKFGSMFISLIITLGAYVVFFGWKFAIVLLYLLFIHEMGHLVAAKQKGIKTSPAIFVPFIGAMIAMKEQPRDAATEAYLAYGGPLAGLISFLPAIPLYYWTHDPVWMLMVFLGAFLNLFNLFPVSPLDGGRVVSVLSTKIWLLGLLAMIPLLYFIRSPVLILIFIIGCFTWWRRARETYRSDVLRYQVERGRRYIGECQSYQNELFFMRSDEEGQPEPVMISEMRLFRLQECKNRIKEIQSEISHHSTFYVPFVQDGRKLEKEKLKIDLSFERKKEDFLEGPSLTYDDLQAEMKKLDREIKHIEEEISRLHSYYQAPAKTKWKVLVLYVALAAVLAFFYFHAQQIVNQSVTV